MLNLIVGIVKVLVGSTSATGVDEMRLPSNHPFILKGGEGAVLRVSWALGREKTMNHGKFSLELVEVAFEGPVLFDERDFDELIDAEFLDSLECLIYNADVVFVP